jgi:hypothetical protein
MLVGYERLCNGPRRRDAHLRPRVHGVGMRCWVAVHLVPALLTAVASLCSSVAAQPLLRALESPRVHPSSESACRTCGWCESSDGMTGGVLLNTGWSRPAYSRRSGPPPWSRTRVRGLSRLPCGGAPVRAGRTCATLLFLIPLSAKRTPGQFTRFDLTVMRALPEANCG